MLQLQSRLVTAYFPVRISVFMIASRHIIIATPPPNTFIPKAHSLFWFYLSFSSPLLFFLFSSAFTQGHRRSSSLLLLITVKLCKRQEVVNRHSTLQWTQEICFINVHVCLSKQGKEDVWGLADANAFLIHWPGIQHRDSADPPPPTHYHHHHHHPAFFFSTLGKRLMFYLAEKRERGEV